MSATTDPTDTVQRAGARLRLAMARATGHDRLATADEWQWLSHKSGG